MLHRQGDAGGARIHYMRALGCAPHDAALRHDYAVLLMQDGCEVEAIAHFRQVLDAMPGRLDTHLALALCLRACERVAEAMPHARTVAQSAPTDPLGWLVYGSLLQRAGDPTGAEAALRRCLALAPDAAEAWHYLGECLQAQRRWTEAAEAYRRAMREQPVEIINVAACAEHAGDLEAAREGYLQAVALLPGRADCRARLAQIAARLCDFEGETAATLELEARLKAPLPADDVVEPFPLAFLTLSDGARRQALDGYVRHVVERTRHVPPLPAPPRRSDAHVRIGYISADLGAHAVGDLVQDLFAAHDRARFRVHAYSLRRHADDIATHIREGCDAFVDCENLASDAIARRIRDDGIDVLVDLSGYTLGGRPEVLAMRPARVQLGWLGFVHPHQAPWLDALLLDEHVLPLDAPWPYDDRVIRLPGTLLPASKPRRGTRDRRRFGLPADEPVLASFNNAYKLDAPLLDAWATILRRVPNAHLLVYLPPAARPGFMRNWRRVDGDQARLRIVDALPPEEQASRAASCDLMLDAFRYQAGATGIAAVGAGLPLLSRVGSTPAGRLGVSLNRALGLDELVCSDTTAYVEQAIRLASDACALQALHARLPRAAREARLFDPRRSAEAIEDVAVAALSRPRAPAPHKAGSA